MQPTERAFAEALDAADPLAHYRDQFVLTDPVPFFTDPLPSVPDYGGKAIRWSHGSATLYLTASQGDDAGEVSGGVVRVEVGNVGPGEAGEVCYRAQIR